MTSGDHTRRAIRDLGIALHETKCALDALDGRGLAEPAEHRLPAWEAAERAWLALEAALHGVRENETTESEREEAPCGSAVIAEGRSSESRYPVAVDGLPVARSASMATPSPHWPKSAMRRSAGTRSGQGRRPIMAEGMRWISRILDRHRRQCASELKTAVILARGHRRLLAEHARIVHELRESCGLSVHAALDLYVREGCIASSCVAELRLEVLATLDEHRPKDPV